MELLCRFAFVMQNGFVVKSFTTNCQRHQADDAVSDHFPFPVAASRAWNSLPASVRDIQSLPAFRQKLKLTLFSDSFAS